MIEIILIIILAILVIIQTVIITTRSRRNRMKAVLEREAVGDLIQSIRNNISSGKIQDVAGSVSDILKKHLYCDRIIFLKYFRSNLELNFSSGIDHLDRNSIRLKIRNNLQEKLRENSKISRIADLSQIVSKEYYSNLDRLGIKYYFPVFLREKLYGLYLISTKLPPHDSLLNLLAATLAFNLSTAYHIGLQDQKLSRYADRIKSLTEYKKKTSSTRNSREILKYLRLRNCRQLVPELIKSLNRDGDFSRLGFYLKTESVDDPWLSVNYNISQKADAKLKDNFDFLIEKIETEVAVPVEKIERGKSNLSDELMTSHIGFLMAVPWTDRRKAILAWSSKKEVNGMVKKIHDFRRDALPLIDNIARFERVEELSHTDGLTGMYNFRYFKKRIIEEIQRAKRYNRELSLLIFDVDDLKQVNDNYGHLAGDTLLLSFGDILQGSVRSNDVVSRYGGDEFCLIMPETGRNDTEVFMERIQKQIAGSKARIERMNKSLEFSVSIGGAVFPEDAESVEELIHAADMALLKAKEEGGNRGKMYQPEFERKKELD